MTRSSFTDPIVQRVASPPAPERSARSTTVGRADNRPPHLEDVCGEPVAGPGYPGRATLPSTACSFAWMAEAGSRESRSRYPVSRLVSRRRCTMTGAPGWRRAQHRSSLLSRRDGQIARIAATLLGGCRAGAHQLFSRRRFLHAPLCSASKCPPNRGDPPQKRNCWAPRSDRCPRRLHALRRAVPRRAAVCGPSAARPAP